MTDTINARDRRSTLFKAILGPENSFYWLAVIYSIATSVLTLAVPLSVQVLIATVSNTALLQPVVVLALILFGLLAMYGALYVVQAHLMDRFERRFFARYTQEIVLRSVHSTVAAGRRMNREELANRFFEIVTVQRNVPTLILNGSAILMQAIVGILVVSAYHPAFVVFSVALVLIAWLIWKIWANRAIDSKIDASKEKFKVARWLEELARVHPSFQSTRTIRYATREAENLIAEYASDHRRHFSYKLAQTIGYFGLYAVASAALLGVGGWLVIINQLTLGQLVAAELIFAAVFYSLTRLPWLLDTYYELCAAVDKLGEFLELELEDATEGEDLPAGAAGLRLDGATVAVGDGKARFSFTVPAGRKVFVNCEDDGLRDTLLAILRRHRPLASGRVQLGAAELGDLHLHRLRDAVLVIDSTEPLERTIAENLGLDDPAITRSAMREVLDLLGLSAAVDRLPDGLDTVLARCGDPLTAEQMLLMRIASALLDKPRLLIVTPVADRLSLVQRQAVLDAVRRQPELTYLQFSRRADVLGFDAALDITAAEQRWFDDLRSLPLHTPAPQALPSADRGTAR
ncbi:ABC transporter transmembrane domain-containing protein [Nevskia ramosa]|uniref:ABC transporter transmembrane domain-containing protein n=1 Tax=Nevskia ramosa TaxID=64002 RepID=UPI0003B70CED|nr:ABC transporter transmembrane domain-containing protein [Nevskia ramosa]